jgi:hypothetical protein
VTDNNSSIYTKHRLETAPVPPRSQHNLQIQTTNTIPMSAVFYILAAVLVGLFSLAQAHYAIGYVATPAAQDEHQLIRHNTLTFREAPDALHVADLVARLNGHAPLLREGRFFTHLVAAVCCHHALVVSMFSESMNLPAVNNAGHNAVLLELFGGGNGHQISVHNVC